MACKNLNKRLRALVEERARLLEAKRKGAFVSPALKLLAQLEDALLAGDEKLAKSIAEKYKKGSKKVSQKYLDKINAEKYTYNGKYVTALKGVKDMSGRILLTLENEDGRRFILSERALKAESDIAKYKATKVEDYVESTQDDFTSNKILPEELLSIYVNTGNMIIRHTAEAGANTLLSVLSAPSKAAHNAIKKNFPLYAEMSQTLNSAWNESQFVQEMKGWTNIASDKFNRDALNNFLSQTLIAMENRNEHDSSIISSMESALKKDFKGKNWKKLNARLHDVWARSGIYALVDKELEEIGTGKKTVDELLRELEKGVTDTAVTDYLSDLYIYGENLDDSYLSKFSPKDRVINLNSRGPAGDPTRVKLEKITALKALKKLNAEDDIKEMWTKPDSLRAMLDAVAAIKLGSAAVYKSYGDKNAFNQRGNLIKDIYDNNYEVVPVSMDVYDNGMLSNAGGYQILREPTADSLGLVYRKRQGSFITGAGLNINFISNGIQMGALPDGVDGISKGIYEAPTKRVQSKRYKSFKTSTQYHMMFTPEEEEILGLNKSIAHTLIRTSGHNREILETKKVREAMVSMFTFKVETDEDVDKLYKIIKDEEKENPWHLNLFDLDRSKLSEKSRKRLASIQKKYVKASGISSIDGLNNKLSVTRMDLHSQLNGYDDTVFKDNRYNQANTVLKKIVSYTKIQQVIINLSKIGADFTAGISLLMTIGMGPLEIWTQFKNIVDEMRDLTRLRNKKIGLEFLVTGKDHIKEGEDKELDGLRRQLKQVNESIRTHKLAPALFNGMIQSISTDITLKNYETISGLDKDIKDIISKVTRREDGDLNKIGRAIMDFANNDVDMTKLVDMLASGADSATITKPIGDVLQQFSDGVKRAKSEEDVEKYISEFIGAPGSELTKLGSALTQWSDVLPRVALYRFRKSQGYSETAAVQEALDSFVDYKLNMPKPIHQLSSTFFLMYPSFWMKIQKVIWNLATKNPIQMSTSLLLEELLGTEGLHVLDANILSKIAKGSAITAPEFDDLQLFYANFY